MNRRSVIRCILGLAAAPKILAELDFKPPIVAQSTAALFRDLNFVIPQYYKTYVEKYGNANFTTFMETVGSKELITNTDYIWFEIRPKTIQS